MAVDLEKVQAIVERVAASQGLEVVEVELRGGGKARMLRIFIDKASGKLARRTAWLAAVSAVLIALAMW